MTIHWFDSLMKRNICFGQCATMRAQTSSTTFFQNVCQLVSTNASPKHPQSLMGLAKANQSVSGVITSMIITIRFDVSRR